MTSLTARAGRGRRVLSVGAPVAILAGLLIVVRGDLDDAVAVVKAARSGWLAAAAVCSLVGALAMAGIFVCAQRAVGLPPGGRWLRRAAVTGASLNLVLTAGGGAGLPPMLADARRRRLPTSSVVTAYALASALTYAAFCAVAGPGLMAAARGGALDRLEVVVALVFAGQVLVVSTVALLLLRRPALLSRLAAGPGRLWAALRRRPAPPPRHDFGADVLAALHEARRHRRWLAAAVACAVAVEVAGVGTLLTVLTALDPDPPALGARVLLAVVGYVVGVFVASAWPVPGGLGAVELSLGAVLVAGGLPVGVAAGVVLLQRVLELGLPLLLGVGASVWTALDGRAAPVGVLDRRAAPAAEVAA